MTRHWSFLPAGLLALGLVLGGCTTSQRIDYIPPKDRQPVADTPYQGLNLSPELEEKMLALDPENVTPLEVSEVLSQAPAPRIINLHGGRIPVYKQMVSLSKFLEGMGYPESRLRNPLDGTYSYSGYISSKKIAGLVAWYYEREGLRPMMIGHSLGGFQNVRVLYQLSGDLSDQIPVWNPLTDEAEDRCEITDPLTGETRPVVGLSLCFVSSLGAGGMTWVLPNTWSMTGKLRHIPDTTDAFTGYYMGMDFVGGDFGGFGSANHYQALGHAKIRNVQLPTWTTHATAPDTEDLLKDAAIIEWINQYTPTNRPTVDGKFESKSKNLPYAADIWHEVRKHWILELQRVIREERAARHEP